MRKLILILLSFIMFLPASLYAEEENLEVYMELRDIDRGTFNEYRYNLTKQYFLLRESFEIDRKMNIDVLNEMMNIANNWYKYLPDNLENQNYLNYLLTSIKKWIKTPTSHSNYVDIVSRLSDYVWKVKVNSITWKVSFVPSEWNAPLTVTLRWNIKDPTWTKIPSYNYTWWIDSWGEKKVIWNWSSTTYTFTEEWNFSVFLDVKSNHRNNNSLTDILPFREKVDIKVKEKVASLILKINGISMKNIDSVKFSPWEASYGLIFDATSSIPASWAKFTKTIWDFGNGVTKQYSWWPRIERAIYVREWEYKVKLRLETNELKSVERNFTIYIRNLIATIKSDKEKWYIWDKLIFSARPSWDDKNLSYSWEIVNINKDKVVYRKAWSNINYTFLEKWNYNVKLIVTSSSWESDIDSRIIKIQSRPPIARLSHSVPEKNKPNKVLFDASKSYDPDFSDEWNLKFYWNIDWERVNLEDSNAEGSVWYYIFDSIWTHSVWLEVVDLDWIRSLKSDKVMIKSILAVEVFAFPRAIQRESFIKFTAMSPEAEVFEWDFWDWTKTWWVESKVSHIYKNSWVFNVKVKVIDKKWAKNTHSKDIYVWNSEIPLAMLETSIVSKEWELTYKEDGCEWKWAYIVNRVDVVKFDGKESINIDWKNWGLSYSWKIWESKYSQSQTVNNKFDEFWCFPIKLTVTSKDNWKSNTKQIYVEVVNIPPTLNSLNVNITNPWSDPLIVNVEAVWAKDLDWVIQSYLWYYYTDLDSEPQDFRATSTPNTTFVIPKVTWHYYFVVILKDDNEARSSSEDITKSKFYITVTGDNINTPLIDLKVNDSSLLVWDNVTFTANVKNILWQNIAWKSVFSWDFDGDWFYDKTTSINSVDYRFTKSWEFHSKVKVKHKWLSNTRSITLNIWNKLIPDFDYISIWNKFIFFSKSTWKIDNIEWDLWDWVKLTWNNFIHTYKDKKSTHKVVLTISEWTKTEKKVKVVVKNVKNMIKAHKKWINLFAYPEIDKENTVYLEREWEKVYVYMWESKADAIENYIVDFDIDLDSDLNWGKDDDEDNKWTSSFTSWDVLEVLLNEKKQQIARFYLKDKSWKIIDSKDIIIIKNYISEKDVDLNKINFKWISDNDREKVEKLKELISKLPSEYRLKSAEYIQKLQEEWFDKTEKTRIILEFEDYLVSNKVDLADDIIEQLEALIIEWDWKMSEKAVALSALKNLLPTNIECEYSDEYNNCYSFLINKLETINSSDDVDLNKKLWSEILEAIKTGSNMTKKQWEDFKAILLSLIHWWLNNIPESEKEEVKQNNSDSSSSILWSIGSILLYLIFIFIGVFTFSLVWFFIYYKLSNKDEELSFGDFILHKTSFKNSDEIIVDDEKEDILWWLDEKEDKTDLIQNSVFSEKQTDAKEEEKELKQEKQESKKETKKEEKVVEDKKKEEVPDWLSWSFWEEKQTDAKEEEKELKQEKQKSKKETKKEEKVVEDKKKEKVPDWLSWSFWEEKQTDAKEEEKELKQEKQESKKEIKKEEKVVEDKKKEKVLKVKSKEIKKEDINNEKDIDIDEETSLDDDNTPDWLNRDFWKIEEAEKNQDKKEESNIPDWLSWSFWEEKQIEVKEEKKQKEKKELKKEDIKEKQDKEEEIIIVEESNKKEVSKDKSKEEKKEEKKVFIKTENKKEEGKKDNAKKIEDKSIWELWDDWMEVPDWLKTPKDK